MYIALTICWYHALKINVSENRKGNKKNGQSREIGNIGYTRNKMKTKKNTIHVCVGHHYSQTNTNNVNKT